MLIVDGHCDTLSRCLATGQALWENSLHWDIKRAEKTGIGIQFMAIYNHTTVYQTALAATLEQIVLLKKAEAAGQVQIITREKDLEVRDRLAVILHLEGGDALGVNPDLLIVLYELGLRSLGLTWNHRNQLADGVGVRNPEGLTTLGWEVLKKAAQLGMIIDIAHLAAPGVDQILDTYSGTVVYTHGNYGEVHNHPRNISKSQAQRLAERGGVIGLSFYPPFIAEKAGVSDWLKHLIQLCEDIGCDHIALGSDFDGDDNPLLVNDITFYKGIPELLGKAGFNQEEIRLIMGENWLRIIKQAMSPK